MESFNILVLVAIVLLETTVSYKIPADDPKCEKMVQAARDKMNKTGSYWFGKHPARFFHFHGDDYHGDDYHHDDDYEHADDYDHNHDHDHHADHGHLDKRDANRAARHSHDDHEHQEGDGHDHDHDHVDKRDAKRDASFFPDRDASFFPDRDHQHDVGHDHDHNHQRDAKRDASLFPDRDASFFPDRDHQHNVGHDHSHVEKRDDQRKPVKETFFPKHNKNGDKGLDIGEFAVMLLSFWDDMSNGDVCSTFDMVNTNGDSHVTLKEWETCLSKQCVVLE